MDVGRGTLVGTALLVLGLASVAAEAGDWPMYRYDAARGACSPETLPASLPLQWVYEPRYGPQPAWSPPAERPREGFLLKHRVGFDDVFHVVVGCEHVYFASSSDCKVYAVRTATGELSWSFPTGGPIRLAPTLWSNRVYVGSDDGFVYCLAADDGRPFWTLRAAPNDEKLLGNGRMISRWPIRTGVLVYEDTLYFGAGVFPHENVYLYAADPETGRILWKNDTLSQDQAYRNDLSPQGYLLATEERLFVPSGRGLPVGFMRATGAFAFSRNVGWRSEQAGGLVGGTYAVLADGQIYTGTQGHLLAMDQMNGRTGFAWLPGNRLAIDGEWGFLATGSEIAVLRRIKYAQASRLANALAYRVKSLRSQARSARGDARRRLQEELTAAEKTLREHERKTIQETIVWRTASDCNAEMIACRNRIVAGGQGKIEVFDRATGQQVFRAEVDGKASGLAVAEGRLLVSTDSGRIYCFGQGQSKGRMCRTTAVETPYPEDELSEVYARAAESIIRHTAVKRGHCLVLGAEQGRLAYELAQRTDLMIIGAEPDSEKAAAARKALDAAGLYGSRVVIDEVDLSDLPYSDYFANLVVSDSLLLTGRIPAEADTLVRHVKPCGGVVCLGAPQDAPALTEGLTESRLGTWMTELELGQSTLSRDGGLWVRLERGPLAGAGRWTHQYAEPGNTACSDDRIIGGPLGLLWFGEPGSAPMVNRHDAAAAPLVVNGRTFIQGENNVMAYDSYNGVRLWKRHIPGALRTQLKRYECGNLAADDGSLFVALAQKCLRLRAETGQTLYTYPLPPSYSNGKYRWGYLAHDDGVLYGSAMTETGVSHAVFAMDVENGEVLWQVAGQNIVNLTIAVGDGWLFFVDSALTPGERSTLLRQDKSALAKLTGQAAEEAEAVMKRIDLRQAVAVDARTGGKIWQKPVDVTNCSVIGIGGGQLSAMYREGVIVLCGANANGHYWRQFLSGQFSERRLVALSARDGHTLWAKDADYRHRPVIIGDTVLAEPWMFDLKTGRERTRIHPVTGQETRWQFLRPGHHCGAISACQQMLFMRSGSTSYYDLQEDSGIRHFAGHRPGCWINVIPADGLAVIPEASAGCVCLFPIVCTVVMQPRRDHERWGIYSAPKVEGVAGRLAVNLGAPGDCRDKSGRMWFGYPRPSLPSDRAALGFDVSMEVQFANGGTYVRLSPDAMGAQARREAWLYSSFASGIRRCVLPIVQQAKGGVYTVRLYLMASHAEKGANAFTVRVQGNEMNWPVDLTKAFMRECQDIEIEDNLEIEFLTRGQGAPMPVALCGLEVIRQ